MTLGKKSIGYPTDSKLWKIYNLAYGFSFFVISNSGCMRKKELDRF
jgi:hypothetical protein